MRSLLQTQRDLPGMGNVECYRVGPALLTFQFALSCSHYRRRPHPSSAPFSLLPSNLAQASASEGTRVSMRCYHTPHQLPWRFKRLFSSLFAILSAISLTFLEDKVGCVDLSLRDWKYPLLFTPISQKTGRKRWTP